MRLVRFKNAVRFLMGEGGSLKSRVLRSGFWLGAAQGFGGLLNVFRSIALARLLTPEMFGLMGIASIAVQAIENVTRPGVTQALIARQRSFDEASGTTFTLLIVRGVLLAILLAIAAPWIARFYDSESLEPMLMALSLVFLLNGFININTIAKLRDLEFRRLTYLSQATNAVATVTTIALAFWLRNVWALVVGQVVSVATNAVLSYCFVKGRPRMAFDSAIAKELLLYGRFITGSSIVLFIASQLDAAVIGKMLGTHELGLYTLAATIASLVTLNISKIASSVMMPAYSKLQQDKQALRRVYLRTLSLLMLIVLPASAGLVVAAESILGVVYGERWLDAATPLQILAVFGIFRTLTSFTGYLFEGIGKPRVPFRLGIVRLTVVLLLVFPMTYYLGLRGAALAVTVASAVQWVAGLRYLKAEMGINVSDIARVLWRPVWTAIAMAVVVLVIAQYVDRNTLLGLTCQVMAGVAAYAAVNFRVARTLWQEKT